MHRTITLASAAVLAGLLLAACAPGPMGGGSGGPMPTCLPAGLVAPVMIAPADGTNIEIPGLTFRWSYSPAG